MHTSTCFVAGTSGGHLIPALTMAHTLKKTDPDHQILFFSTNTPLDTTILRNKQQIDRLIPCSLPPIPGKKLWRYPLFITQLLNTFFKSFLLLLKTKPAKIVSTGGLISIPICLAGWLLRIPIELFELNATPGKAIHFLTPYATTIHVCFRAARHFFPAHKTTLKQYPLTDTAQKQNHNKKTSGTCILILGGSQGSLFINKLVGKWLDSNTHLYTKLQIIHQTGSYDTTDWASWYAQRNIDATVFSYTHSLYDYYTQADLVICRSGAGTLFETVFFNKQCITIPLETAYTNHQVDNAQALHKQYPHLVTVIRQKDLTATPQELTDQINTIIGKGKGTHS